MPALLVLVALFGCSSPPDPEGTVVDGLTGRPLTAPDGATLALVAEAREEVADECRELRAELGPDGTFHLPLPCRGAHYALRLDGLDHWLEPQEITRRTGPVTITAWPAPATSGVWRLVGGELSPVAASARVREEVAANGDVVRLPDVLPSPPPRVDAGAWLVLATEGDLVPLIESGPRELGDPAAPRAHGSWHYLGVRFDEQGAPVAVASPVDEARLVRRERDGVTVTWVPGDAVPAGLYGVEGGDRRLWIVAFGE